MTSSANQFQKPLTLKTNADGNLELGGCDLAKLADEFGTPLYVVDEYTLRQVCKDYKKSFSGYKDIKILYASKALCTSAIAKIVDSEGLGFDVVSEGELYTLYKSGIDLSKVLFNGNNKSYDELAMAIELGVGRISVDNFFELALLNEICSEKNKKADVLLRITPGIECHTHEYIQTGHLDCKFGFDLTQIDEAVELILGEYENINLLGLHAHVGSQIFETGIFSDEIDILCREVSRISNKYKIELNEINIGGGFGVKYTKQENPPSLCDVGELIIKELNKAVQKYSIKSPKLYLEPGRSIISNSCITIYTVGSSKQVPQGRKYVSVDGGMADNIRPALYQAQYEADVVSKKEGDVKEKITIAGRYCESGDILIENIELPVLEAGDLICIYNTGAYNYSMASNYNRVQKPAMVLVNNSQADIIISRETLDDLVLHDIIPDRLKL